MRFESVLACSVVAPLLIAASRPVELQPSSPWVVDYAENSCRLIRTFGDDKHKIVLAFESEAPDQMDLLAAGKDLYAYKQQVPARFLPAQGKEFEGDSVKTAQNGSPAILWSRVRFLPDDLADKLSKEEKERERISKSGVRPPPIDLGERAKEKAARAEFASKVTSLEIRASEYRPVILETGPLDGAIKAFDKCSRDSLRDWGVNPDVEDKIVRPVWAADASKWFSGDDYPKDMLFEGEQSEVKVRLLVDATGRVTNCTTVSHFNLPKFNQVVCDKFMKRARFEPAELADGTKVPSYYVNLINFRIAQ